MKAYEYPPIETDIVEEPFVMYGTLNLDESKRWLQCGESVVARVAYREESKPPKSSLIMM